MGNVAGTIGRSRNIALGLARAAQHPSPLALYPSPLELPCAEGQAPGVRREYMARGRFGTWILALEFALVAFALLACHRSAEEKAERTDGSQAEHRARGDVAEQRADGKRGGRVAEADAEPVVHVPVGAFRAGSRPAEPGRHPETEPGLHSVTLGPFRMDRRLRTRVDREHNPGVRSSGGASGESPRGAFGFEEAQVVCAEAGGRLCTEVEWERACKGPRSTVYAGGDEPCATPHCTSGYDVEEFGAGLEWTASAFPTSSPFHGERVLRGSPQGAPAAERRCARRIPESERPSGEPVSFRCCYGAPNAERLKDPEERASFREVDVPLAELQALLERDVRTKPLTEGLAYFADDAAATVLSRGPGDTMGFSLTTRGVLWSPERGVELLVVSGRSGPRTAFVVAYFSAGDERILAGSFIMKNEPGPIALAYAPSIRPRMHFSSCWGCPGETGKLLFRPPESVVLLQP